MHSTQSPCEIAIFRQIEFNRLVAGGVQTLSLPLSFLHKNIYFPHAHNKQIQIYIFSVLFLFSSNRCYHSSSLVKIRSHNTHFPSSSSSHTCTGNKWQWFFFSNHSLCINVRFSISIYVLFHLHVLCTPYVLAYFLSKRREIVDSSPRL